MVKSKNTRDGLLKMIDDLLEIQAVCPECNSPLYGWKTKKENGAERCVPTCMECGYTSLRKREKEVTQKLYDENIRGNAFAFFLSQSVITDKKLLKCDLGNYRAIDEETSKAKKLANQYIHSVISGDPTHMVLTGKTGTGKSHLAMGICYAVMEQSNYNLSCIVVNYRELLEKLKNAFNDPQAQREIQGVLMNNIKKANLVVIDDLGAELGGGSAGQSTIYNNDVINSIMEARQNEATVITTNLTGKELQQAYGKRIVSRISQHLGNYSLKFEKTPDKRRNKI